MKEIDVISRLEKIRIAGIVNSDDEVAHVLEKDLWQDVLTAISLGETTDPKQLATLALKSGEIEFSRWYA